MMRLPSRRGVSLLELVVVISLIMLLVALGLHGIQSARDAAARAACQNNLRQISLASLNYESVRKTLPPSYSKILHPPPDRDMFFTWCLLLCPYLEQEALYRNAFEAMKIAFPIDPAIHPGLATVVKVFACPADSRVAAPITDQWGVTAAYCSYVGNAGDKPRIMNYPDPPNFSLGTIMRMDQEGAGVPLSTITDGVSNTLLFGERPPPGLLLYGSWYSFFGHPAGNSVPTAWNGRLTIYAREKANECAGELIALGPGRVGNDCDSWHYWSLHRGGANFSFADGSVRFLRYSQSDIVPALATRASGEPVSFD